MLVKTGFCPNGIEIPYTIKVDNPKARIGVFGDSFAQLAEFHAKDKNFTHENSWIYFLANILNAECDTYGVSMANMPDIFYTIFNCEEEYDYYIIWHTMLTRDKGMFSDIPFTKKTCEKLKDFLTNKKAIIVYWDIKNKIFDFNKPEYECTEFLTNQNLNESRQNSHYREPNPLDQLGGYHHMSARGNLLFALNLSKYIKL